jgi:hypothetical protein
MRAADREDPPDEGGCDLRHLPDLTYPPAVLEQRACCTFNLGSASDGPEVVAVVRSSLAEGRPPLLDLVLSFACSARGLREPVDGDDTFVVHVHCRGDATNGGVPAMRSLLP